MWNSLAFEDTANGEVLCTYKGAPICLISATETRIDTRGVQRFALKVAINQVAVRYNLGFQIMSIPGPGTWIIAPLRVAPNGEYRFDETSATPYVDGISIPRPVW